MDMRFTKVVKNCTGYDDFPHSKDLSLATTFPHHKHIPPEMNRNRVPAPNISFICPNLPILIQEIEALIA
jgi:hypothetical protein